MSVQYLTVREVAERLNISAWLAHQHCKSGRLACYHFGLGRRGIRVSEEQLAEFIAQSEHVCETVKRERRRKEKVELKYLKIKDRS